jgi:hypothetical protein
LRFVPVSVERGISLGIVRMVYAFYEFGVVLVHAVCVLGETTEKSYTVVNTFRSGHGSQGGAIRYK